jgi:hypothetical protein
MHQLHLHDTDALQIKEMRIGDWKGGAEVADK